MAGGVFALVPFLISIFQLAAGLADTIIRGTTARRDPYSPVACILRRSFNELEKIASSVPACPFGFF
jgi:hypothetical protein